MNSVCFGAVKLTENFGNYVRLQLTGKDVHRFKPLKGDHNTVLIFADPENTLGYGNDAFAYYPASNSHITQAASTKDMPLFQDLLNRAVDLPSALKQRLLEALEIQVQRNAVSE